jgi:signal transduction histidine kinase
MERLFRSFPEMKDTRFEVSSQDVSAVIDAQDLEEMLGNLLENALKWSKDAVSLRVEVQGASVHILIEDDGPGIAEAQRAAVLEEGMRLDTSMPGTGLGLSIVNDLAKAYGGSLALDHSESLGGLKCRVTLPKARQKTVAYSLSA